MRTMRLLEAVAALAAVLVAVAPATAQDRPSYELPAIEVTVLQNDLHQTAISLYEFPSYWELAGDLHKRAADDLPRNAAGQFFGYNRAAVLYFHAGEFADCAQVHGGRGPGRRGHGRLLRGGKYVRGRGVHSDRRELCGQEERVRERSAELADSEWITAEEKADILIRIEGAPAGPASARVAFAMRLGFADDAGGGLRTLRHT